MRSDVRAGRGRIMPDMGHNARGPARSWPGLLELGPRAWVIHSLFRGMLLAYQGLVGLLESVAGGCSRAPKTVGYDIILTGTFYSDNWVKSHLAPLARCRYCRRLRVVSTHAVPDIPGVEAVYAPTWLTRFLGQVPARMLTFAWLVLRDRPDIVGGFHLLMNGLAAIPLARAVGARAVYFCVGGPMELLGGGVWTESRLFRRIHSPDAVLEHQLLWATARFDLIVTMGSGAVEFFHQRGVRARACVVAGGIDAERFTSGDGARPYDMILVGRLAEIKRIDLFLQVVREVSARVPQVRAVIVGDGELRGALEAQARELGIAEQVVFAGHQRDVGRWLRQAKVFVLTSRSEGLALSLMEAMTCGLPAVVTKVGDLGDLVEQGVNGYLIERDAPAAAFAEAIVGLLTDERKLASFGRAAQAAALGYTLEAARRRWDEVLAPAKMA